VIARLSRSQCCLTKATSSHNTAVMAGGLTREDVAQDKFRGPRMFPHVQMIDMLPEGRINAHCDNAKMFGAFTCGLNLSSAAVSLLSAFASGPAFRLQLVRFPILTQHPDSHSLTIRVADPGDAL
jgi:hypothetical protein